MNLRNLSGILCAGVLVGGPILLGASCGSSPGGGGGTAGTGGSSGNSGASGSGGTSGSGGCKATVPADETYDSCSTCKFSSTASPSACTAGRSVNACCDWVQAPASGTTLVRATGLHDYSSTSGTAVDFGCLTSPPTAGPSHMSTLTGYVKIFNSQTDTAGVKVQVFTVDTATGALGAQVGSTYTTTTSDKSETNTWLNACTGTPCTFRQYTITGVPTETPLVIETSDAGMHLWSTLYDYNIYFSDASKCATGGGPCVKSSSGSTWQTSYDVTAVAPADIQTAANAAGGFTLDPAQGVLAGEVHDCGDIRVEGANVDTDQAHQGPVFYFGANESNPLPDQSRGAGNLGTSVLGLFGALNIKVGTPVRVSAIGNLGGKDTLLGTSVVQVFPGPSVTAISLRGRRPYQK